MGELEGWPHMGGGGGGSNRLLPNGLLPNATPLIESLDSERWLKAEERTAELITCIQPNQPSEARRNAVADYVQRLIMKCFPCQVFTFGSVPLKTYLPDGDIDLTAFSNSPNLKDSWASEVRDLLETEEKNENAEFHVKEVQYIQAEVKIIKCLVENIVVDISFNQLGGLCTLCFLEEVDNLINQDHLFKRSIILIKAWCYYESRILGAHHGLISTYALETLVLYIFHVFNNSFAGPLEVLYRFLEFFSSFDWDNFCVSLWGPVPINSLPDVTAEPPRKDSGELLLNKVFLDACSSVYAVFPAGQDSQGQPFLSKHFNVIDPLRVSNNLGRSVSKGNFFRIRSAFAFGAKRLARLLDCPKENLVAEVNRFFTNTWDRHGNGIRPDAPVITDSLILKFSTDSINSQNTPKVGGVSVPNNQKSHANTNSLKLSDPIGTKSQRNLKAGGHLVNDIQRSPFARTRSSPELTDTYKYVPFQGTRNKQPEPEKNPDTHTGSNSYRRKNLESESNQTPPHQSIDTNVYHHEDMHLEEQNLVNMMASSGFHGGQLHMPMNLNLSPGHGNLPFPISPSFLASLGYTQRAFSGMQFPPHGHYFSGLNDDSVDENTLSGDDSWRSETVPQEESNKPQPSSSSSSMSYVPPPRRVRGSGGLVRSQPKNNKEKRERNNNNHLPEETDRRFSLAAAHRSRTSSESSWDESSKPRGKKTTTTDQSEDDQDLETIIPRQRNALTFYPTGPPVPFLTMLPFYEPSGSHFIDENNSSENGHSQEPEEFGLLRGATPGETPSDILNSDFASHWQNLQFGRFCQSPWHHGPTMYPSPVMVPPVYLQGRVPWDGPGRPVPNMNLVMNYGPRIVPVQPNVYQHYVEDMPRYRSGTGTYLPNPKVAVRRRGNPNYNYERSDETNWNGGNSKSRGSGRNNHVEKSTNNRRSMNSQPSTSQSQNMSYGMYQNNNGSNVVMVYPFDQNGEQVEFGSFSEQSPRGGMLEYGDQPSSPLPHHQR
ncbi:hypothetical protein LXL04_026654 [Taraxacum kok-saghyz]